MVCKAGKECASSTFSANLDDKESAGEAEVAGDGRSKLYISGVGDVGGVSKICSPNVSSTSEAAESVESSYRSKNQVLAKYKKIQT